MNDKEMQMYAIRNKKTKKWVYGTDRRFSPPHQRTSYYEALTFESEDQANDAFKHRRCSDKLYEILPVELKEFEQSDANNYGIMISEGVEGSWKFLSPVFNSRKEASGFFRENLDNGKWLFRIVEINIISQNIFY